MYNPNHTNLAWLYPSSTTSTSSTTFVSVFSVEVNTNNSTGLDFLPHLVSFIDSIRDTRSSLILGKMISDTLKPYTQTMTKKNIGLKICRHVQNWENIFFIVLLCYNSYMYYYVYINTKLYLFFQFFSNGFKKVPTPPIVIPYTLTIFSSIL